MPRTMRTFFDSNILGSNDFIYLDEVESHHLMKVLRLREGDEVEALDGQGNKYLTEIYKTDHKQVELRILNKNFLLLVLYKKYQKLSKIKICKTLFLKYL